MSFTALTLRYRHAVWALAIAVTFFGIRAYLTLPMQLFPDTNPPQVRIMTAWPGAAAEDVADSLSRLLEEEFAALAGVVAVRATAQDNLSAIVIEFQYDRVPELAAVEVQNAIARIRGTLPPGIAEPRVMTVSADDRPILTMGLAAADLEALRKTAEDVYAPYLQRLPGVAAVDVFGGHRPAVVVTVDPLRLARLGLSIDAVVGAVRSQNVAAPAGRLRSETRDDLLRIEARATTAAQLAHVPIALPGGGRVYLGDVATVRRGALTDDALFAVDGRDAIAMQVFKTTEGNTVDVVAAAIAAARVLVAETPGVELLIGEETATFTAVSVRNLLDNVWQALLLAAAIIFVFLGRLTPSLIAVASMLLSYAITFTLMKASAIELNMVTLSAVILAVGMVVDASVVVIENIARRRADDQPDSAAAAVAGADEVRLAILAGAGTTIAVLVPLLALPGFVGKVFGPLALTLLYAFTSSVVVALIFVPLMTTVLPEAEAVDRRLGRLMALTGRLMDGGRDLYGRLLAAALTHRRLALASGALILLTGVGAVASRGMEVLPRMDGGSFFVAIETASGSSLAHTRRVVADVETLLRAEPEVRLVQSQVGYEPGMRSLGAGGLQGPTQGFVTVLLTDRTERAEDIWSVQARVRAGLGRIPGIEHATVRELGNTAKSTTAAPIALRLTGPDPRVLDRLAEEALAAIAAVPGVVAPVRNWRLDQERVRIEVDRLAALEWGLGSAAVGSQLQRQLVGMPAGSIWPPEETPLPVWVEAAVSTDRHGVPRVPLVLNGRETVYLDEVLSARTVTGQALVSREDLLPTLEISAFSSGRPLSFILADVNRALASLPLPSGYERALVGEDKDLKESRAGILDALIVAIAAVYLLLVAQFRSFLHPITILSAVPLSLLGVGLGLAVAGKPVSMPVMIGLVLLVGIVVNNSIILLDFIMQARNQGVGRREAILDSVKLRFRPIMMTSLSTVGGMVPLAGEWALGAERFSPLAVAVVGGLTVATFLTLVLVPVLYDALDDLALRLRRVLP